METKIMSLEEALAGKLVPESGTREKIEYLDLDDIQPDPRNFYELSDIDELAANIELFGLQQPLRVRDDPMDPDKVILVSGHRRRAAIAKLVADGRADLREVPCIREREAGSEAEQELRMIFGNASTRKLSGAELARQAERTKELLLQLKKEGFPFPPGRIRDRVAALLQVSKSKLARLDVIRKNLIPTLCMAWEEGELNEEQAYTLAQMDSEMQGFIEGYAYQDKKSWYAWRLQKWAEGIQRIRALECSRTEGRPPCQWQHEKIANFIEAAAPYQCGATCCADCWQLPDCQDACRKCEDAAREKREAREEQAQKAEVRRIEEEDRETRRAAAEALTARWSRVREAVSLSGLDPEETARALGHIEPDEDLEDCDDFCALLAGRAPELSDPDPILPYRFADDDLTALCHAADLLGVTLDYLLGRTDTPEAAEGPKVWQTGRPPRSGRYYARFADEAGPMEMPCQYDASLDNWSVVGGVPITAACNGWWWLPAED